MSPGSSVALSDHHPVYFYIPYLFSQSLPWGLFLPLLLWDAFRTGIRRGDDRIFLKLWFLVMFVFFSLSVGKRAVYLLPLYPALSLLLADWFYRAKGTEKSRLMIYRGIAIFAAVTGVLLLMITLGALWNHDHAWFFATIENLLKPKDRANLIAVKSQLEHFGALFSLMSLVLAALWFSLARSLWFGRMRSVAHQLVPVAIT